MSLILVIIMIVTLFLYLIRKINEIRQLHGIVIPESMVSYRKTKNKTRKNAIVEYLDYQILVTQLKGPH